MTEYAYSKQIVFERMQGSIAELLGIDIEDVQADMSLVEDLGVDSLDLIELAVLIKKEFGIDVSIQNWMREVTIVAKELTLDNLEDKIIELERNTGLLLADEAVRRLKERLQKSANNWDYARTIVAMIRVDTIVNLLYSLLEEKAS